MADDGLKQFLPGGQFLGGALAGDPPAVFQGASLSRSNTSIPSAAWTKAVFQNAGWDTDGFRAGGSLDTFTVPVGLSGKYLLIAALRTVDVAYGLFGVSFWIARGGAPAQEVGSHVPGSNPSPCIVASAIVQLEPGDTVEARAYQDHAAAQLLNDSDANNYFQIVRLG